MNTNSERMARHTTAGWTPQLAIQLIAAGTASVCMLACSGLLFVAVLLEKISLSDIGSVRAGTGLLGIFIIMYRLFVVAMKSKER